MATPKQLVWIKKLADDPRLTPAVKAQAQHIIANPSKNPGNLLSHMFELCPKDATKKGPSWTEQPGLGTVPVKEPVKEDGYKVFGAEFPTVQPGYYAVPNPNGTNDLTFFRVSFGAQFSKVPAMADRVFVKRVVGGHSDMKCESPEARLLLALVTDAKADRARYGQEIGRCGKCNTHLTDDESRERGYGPDCWSNL